MFKNILVATDGSEHAEKAVALAGDLAEKYGAALVVLYVMTENGLPPEARRLAEVEGIAVPPSFRESPLPTIPSEVMPLLEEAEESLNARKVHAALAEHILERAEARAKKAGVKKVRAETGYGDPARGILDAADREKCDLIVMGSRGLGTAESLLMGSVSHKVSHLAACTCVTVK